MTTHRCQLFWGFTWLTAGRDGGCQKLPLINYGQAPHTNKKPHQSKADQVLLLIAGINCYPVILFDKTRSSVKHRARVGFGQNFQAMEASGSQPSQYSSRFAGNFHDAMH